MQTRSRRVHPRTKGDPMIDWARNLSRNGQIAVAIVVIVILLAGIYLLVR
jgi:hypothetical protein